MVKKFLSNTKTKFTAVIAVIMALCFGLIAFGCSKDESDYEYAMRIAKEEFGVKRILWCTGADYRSELTNIYLYDENGYKSPFPVEYFEQERGGGYVLGVDKFGYEMFIAIPDQKSVESGMLYNPRLIQWPFAYSFTEIADFAAEYGYKYADGIEAVYGQPSYNYKETLAVLSSKDKIIDFTKNIFDDAEKKYEELDVKVVLHYAVYNIDDDEDNFAFYYITQEGGKLKLYEARSYDPNITEITYERKHIEDAVNIARADFGCEKILWVDFAKHQNSVIENCIPPKGGYYVVGVDKDGNEVCIAVPSYESVKYKASAFEWKFDYTFSQIARVFGKYGYKYADGIDGMENEYISHNGSTAIDLKDGEKYVKSALARYGDADELYEKLDVKLIFTFFKSIDGGVRIYQLTQQDGSLVMYETLQAVNGDVINMEPTVYNKDNI